MSVTIATRHQWAKSVADPEILKGGGRNTMPQPRRKLSQMNIMNNMQFVFAICHGVLAEPEHQL